MSIPRRSRRARRTNSAATRTRCACSCAIGASSSSRTSALLIELVAAVLGVLGALLLIAAIVALFRARFMRFAARLLLSAALLSLGSAFGAIAIGMQGYRPLTREELAARIAVQPTAEQRFRAIVSWPDGRRAVYDIAGDEIYVDAHILKWHPWANYFGLHTAYELSRV